RAVVGVATPALAAALVAAGGDGGGEPVLAQRRGAVAGGRERRAPVVRRGHGPGLSGVAALARGRARVGAAAGAAVLLRPDDPLRGVAGAPARRRSRARDPADLPRPLGRAGRRHGPPAAGGRRGDRRRPGAARRPRP